MKHDSVHGRFDGELSVSGDTLTVDGRKIRVGAAKDPAQAAWGEVGVDIVVESTGLFPTTDSRLGRIAAGAGKVIQSGPSKDGTPMFVHGVNHGGYDGRKIVSAASRTTNRVALVAKVLNDNWGSSAD